jgi:hypothetical protein
MNTNSFLAGVEGIFRGWPHEVSPASLLRDWSLFVEECEKGYSDNIYEYYNDIRVREWIELILSAPELQQFPELKEFASNVLPIDKRFQALFLPDVSLPKSFWWEKWIPRYAGQELRDDFAGLYGIEIELLE